MINTVETRLKLNKIQELPIDSCIDLWSWGYRKAWKLWNNQHLDESEVYSYFIKFNLFTSRQLNSLINKVKTEHSKITELTKSQLRQHQAKLDNINKFLAKEFKIIDKYNKEITKLKSDKFKNKNDITKLKETYSKINKLTNSIKKKELILKQKQGKFKKLSKLIKLLKARIDSSTFKLCFGSSSLLSQRPGNHSDKFRLTDNQKVYEDIENWKSDWRLARNNIWLSNGDKNKQQGNAEIQYYPQNKKLRLRVTEKEYRNRLKLISKEIGINFDDLNNNEIVKYGSFRKAAKFIEVDNVEFCSKNQDKIIQAINNKQPITAKIIKKLAPNGSIGFYLQLSFDEIVIPHIQLNSKPKTMGIDLNDKGLAYCIVKSDGNKLNIKIENNSTIKPFGFVQWNLDNKSNPKYNKMLTQFAKSKFKNLLIRKAERLGMVINLVNSSYSSIGGYSKYGLINKLPVDVAAALWLARQSIFGEEYKKENNIKFIKKHEELVSLPYINQPKQSKKLIYVDKEWKDIGLELGKNRKLWYENIIKFIQSNSVGELLLQNPFEDLANF